MKIEIMGTNGIKEGYKPILNKYGLEEVKRGEKSNTYTRFYININTLEELLLLCKEMSEFDGSEMIISNSYGLEELEIYNGYRE